MATFGEPAARLQLMNRAAMVGLLMRCTVNLGVSLIALIAGVVALDLAQQALQISHQSVIYALAPQARSRVTTAARMVGSSSTTRIRFTHQTVGAGYGPFGQRL